MSVDALLTRPATLRRVHAGDDVDEYNAPIAEASSASVWTAVQQISRSEDSLQRDTGTATHLGFLAAGTAVDMTDQLIVDGSTYEVVGPPRIVHNDRTGMISHIEVTLAEVV